MIYEVIVTGQADADPMFQKVSDCLETVLHKQILKDEKIDDYGNYSKQINKYDSCGIFCIRDRVGGQSNRDNLKQTRSKKHLTAEQERSRLKRDSFGQI